MKNSNRMIHRLLLGLLLAGALLAPVHAGAAAPSATVTGIPLDAPWKSTVYALARATFRHPAWGWQHCERDYQLAVEVAKGDGLTLDTDVLFAAAFLHDMAAFPPYEQPKTEHGDVAAVKSEPILRDAGFPMAKFPAVQAAMREHMYYSKVGTIPEAIALHDADSLDFLGAAGAARMLALTGEAKPDIQPALKSLRSFVTDIPPKLVTATAKRVGAQRAAELARFLGSLRDETFDTTI
ncbi:MAG: hypothetical protein JWO85_2734 [Candidatus Eremiobacteraeota bacterium]|nr:hypothetical protein [Candidatus Eremiobacteraeota bacterium]